jgi:Zn-finger nucleic acid-binding protein
MDADDVNNERPEGKTILACPKCRAPMSPVTFGDITVDRCTSCQGLWFDILEQRRLREIAGSETIDTGRRAPAADIVPGSPTKLACPRCTAPMTRLHDVDNRAVEYEYCAVCNGAFFDAGEFRHGSG